MDFSLQNQKELFKQLKTSRQGLSDEEAAERLSSGGKNEISTRGGRALLKRILSPFSSLFVIVLVVGGVISYFTGHQADAIIIAVVIGVNAVIEYIQDYSATKVLKSLKQYDAHSVKVRRGGKTLEIDSRQLVVGDIVFISEGEKVPADGRLTDCNDLEIDESALTGESLPVHKISTRLSKKVPIFEQKNMAFKGTLVQAGRGTMVITATGNDTQLGAIAELAGSDGKRAPIAGKIDRLTWRLVAITLVIAAGTILLGLIRGEGLADMVRFAIALIVSVIPEGLPVTLTIIFLLGIQRMAKRRAFVRKLPAVETLGMVTAVATDKTGTLTQNKLQIADTWDPDGKFDADDHNDIWLSVSHSHPDTRHTIERIITAYAEKFANPSDWQEVADLPFDTKRRFTVVLWQHKDSQRYVMYIKGAPETVISAASIRPDLKPKVMDKLAREVGQGARVIAVAKKVFAEKPELATVGYEDMEFVGLISFRDELRPEAADAIAATRAAGIDVYMLTGDHLGTARAIGSEVGIIEQADEAAEGSAIAKLKLNQVVKTLKQVKVFGRILPEHKFKILKALKRDQITAMTGDGVNDAPALTQAHVGIAMGSGTDVAKEASDVVLLDDNYATIVEAIRQGRTIYSNIRKMVFYLLSTNLAEVGTIIMALLVGLPLPVTAAQVLWLNLVTDTTMVIPLGLEPPEPNHMKHPPRSPRESLLSNHMAARLVLTGAVMAVSSLAVFILFLPQGEAVARTMAFVTLVVVQWANSLNARSETESLLTNYKRPNRALWVGLALGVVLQVVVMVGPLQEFMGVTAIDPLWLAYTLPPVLLTLVASELHKLYIRRKA